MARTTITINGVEYPRPRIIRTPRVNGITLTRREVAAFARLAAKRRTLGRCR